MELIIDALEHTALAYQKEGALDEVERVKGFEKIARLARAALAFV